jgi:hypothetical protein
MAASSRPQRRHRFDRGIYEQCNGWYAVCVMVDGRPRFRALSAPTIAEASRQRELLRSLTRVGELPLSPRLTFAEVAGRWLAEFEAKNAPPADDDADDGRDQAQTGKTTGPNRICSPPFPHRKGFQKWNSGCVALYSWMRPPSRSVRWM